MRIVRAIGLRLAFGLLSLIFISFVTFLAGELAPSDAATITAGEKATPAQVQMIRHQMGLDLPWAIRYKNFATGALQFDFGKTLYGTKEPVTDIIRHSLPITCEIAFFAILLAAGVGILLGTFAAVYENRFADRSVLTFSTLGVTVPNFVLAPILVYIFSVKLHILPDTWSSVRSAPDYYYLLLPVIILSLRPMASLTRLTRASMIESLNQEFIRLATAKGVPPFQLIVKHALRNAILPVVTAIGTNFGYLLTGSFVIETAFTIPGLGFETVSAMTKFDTPIIQASVLVSGTLFILVNLAVDITLPFLDPRIREAKV